MKIITNTKKFFSDMINAENATSHKRFIAIFSFITLVIMVALNQIFALDVKDTFIYTFAGLAGLQSTLSVFEKK